MKRAFLMPVRFTGPPAVPTGLTATAISQTQINLAWNGSVDPSGLAAKDYGVYRVGTGLLGYVTSLTYSDTGLTPGTTYTYNVSARSVNNIESSQSIPASATTLANLPSIVTSALPDAMQSSAYTFGMTGSGGTLPYTWSLTVNPSWLSINASTGVLSGTPSATGPVPVTVRLADNGGNSVTRSYTLTVDAAGALTVTHNVQFTINGTGFGSKSQQAFIRDIGAAPLNTIDGQWSSATPNGSQPAIDQMLKDRKSVV